MRFDAGATCAFLTVCWPGVAAASQAQTRRLVSRHNPAVLGFAAARQCSVQLIRARHPRHTGRHLRTGVASHGAS